MKDLKNHENFVLMNNVNHRKPRIYLAGKVTNSGWRSKILPGCLKRTDGISIMYDETAGTSGKNYFYNYEYERDKFIITGPHTISCDHSCFHYSKHAAGNEFLDPEYPKDAYIYRDAWEYGGLSRHDILNACKKQISKSDAVFAYIDEKELYGTAAEIGYAHAKGIPVFIMFPNGWFYEEYWFLTEMAYKYTVDVRPDALKNFFNETVEELNTNIFVCKK